MQWKPISRDVAVEHPLHGFGGWLLALWILMALMQVINLLTVIGFSDDALAMAYGYDNVGWLKLSAAVSVLLWVPFLVLAPMKHPLMPKITIIAIWSGVALSFITLLILTSFMFALTGIAGGVISSGLLTLYLVKSKRVNVTYHYRIPDAVSA